MSLEVWDRQMTTLKHSLNKILEVIPAGSKVCYIDYPVHNNIGDLLIMLGTEEFFRANRITVICRYSAYDCPDQLVLPDDTILVFHGGGNFGDLYNLHQQLREKLVKAHKRNKIVMLPQTVYYKHTSNTTTLVDNMAEHENLYIYVRDENSHELISRFLPNAKTYMCPDMAHYLWPIVLKSTSKNEKTLFLQRRDREAKRETEISDISGDVQDWDDLQNLFDRKLIRVFQLCLQHPASRRTQVLSRLWIWYARILVSKATGLYKQYSFIQTSRLHGHILACLMAKPALLFDNTYGKNSSYYKLWTSSLPQVSMPVNTFGGDWNDV